MGITVPRLESNVGISGTPTPRAQGLGADSFGAGIGQGLSSLGKDIEQVALVEKQNADAGAVLGGMAQVDNLEIKKVTEAKDLKGNLAGVPEVFLQDWDNDISKIRGALGNDAQKAAFDKLSQQRRHSFASTITTHANNETSAYAIGNAKSAVDTASNRAALYHDDPVKFEDARKEIELRTITLASMQGFGPDSEASKQAVFAVNNKVYEDLIQARIAKNPAEAKGLFDAYRTKLTADTAEKIDKQLKPAISFQAGLETANRLIDGNPDKTVGDLLDILRKDTSINKDKEAFAIAESQIKTIKASQELGRKQVAEKVEADVVAPLAKKMASGQLPTLSDLRNDPKSAELLRVDPEKYNKIVEHIITANNRDAERKRAEAERSERKQEHGVRVALMNEERQTKRVQRSNYTDLWSSPEALQTTDLNNLVLQEKITPEQAGHLEARKTNMNKDTLLSEIGEIKTVLGAAKIKEKTPQYDQAIEYITQRKATFEADEKRKPKASEVKEFARESIYKLNTGWFDSVLDKPVYKMNIGDVPKEDRTKIEQALRLKGKTVNDSNIISTYAGTQRKGDTPRTATNFGNRADGTQKGNGWLGVLKRPDGGVSTEISIGVQIDGKETEIPTLVPTLTKEEVSHLLSGGKVTAAITDKAVAHARKQISAGRSPFK